MRTSHSVLTACIVLSVCLLAPRLLAQESESTGAVPQLHAVNLKVRASVEAIEGNQVSVHDREWLIENVKQEPVNGSAMLQGTSEADDGCPIALSKGAGKLAPETDANGMSSDSVVIVTDLGDIRFRFFPKDAPCTVARMRALIASGFYDGLTFHRVVPGFVAQGGDPVGNGTGGSGQRIRPEFNERHHTEGTVAMARSSDPNSADSQFYFSLGTFPHLDGNYTVFGQVVEGMDVVRKIRVGHVMRKVVIEKK